MLLANPEMYINVIINISQILHLTILNFRCLLTCFYQATSAIADLLQMLSITGILQYLLAGLFPYAHFGFALWKAQTEFRNNAPWSDDVSLNFGPRYPRKPFRLIIISFDTVAVFAKTLVWLPSSDSTNWYVDILVNAHWELPMVKRVHPHRSKIGSKNVLARTCERVS